MSTILTALGSLALLLVSIALFGYSFGQDEPNALVFVAGIVLMTLSFAVPIHALGKSSRSW
ncbi:hypothetical protein [Frigoribacterium salinisoli]